MTLTNKSQLRKVVAEIVAAMGQRDKQNQSKCLFDKLILHPKYQQAKCISIYLSTENEIDTRPILRHALEVDSKRCFVPLVVRKTKPVESGPPPQPVAATRMIMVELKSMKDHDSLPVNHYGIKEPGDSFNGQPKGLDLILVPGVAFTRNGERLGHGKGYYDEYLSAIKESSEVYSIGLAFKQQVLDELPTTELDFVLDEVMSADSS